MSAPDTPEDGDDGPELLNRQRQVGFSASQLTTMRAFLLRLEEEVSDGRPFSLCLLSDAAMRRYNRRFRGVDAPTDVLAFPDGSAGRVGDLLVSAETARRQARRLGHALETEIRILTIHGLLHLLGCDHGAPRAAARMARLERRWRRRYALPLGLIERAHRPPASAAV